MLETNENEMKIKLLLQTKLPDYYEVWMDIACNLTHLIESQCMQCEYVKTHREILHHLHSHRELRLAHLALGVITMGYVWQEGQMAPAQVLPRNLAVPYCLLSQKLGLPPILVYADVVLANWKLKDPNGNIEVIFSLPGGETCSGFIIVSMLVEKAAGPGIMVCTSTGLGEVTRALKSMKEAFELMHSHVDPTIFHATLRIFLSGWRDNPMLPNGLVYEDISDEPVLLSGGSAGQSSSIQCFDALLCVRHYDETAAFLARMREYMPAPHQRLIHSLSGSLRDFIMPCSNPDLCRSYNSCITALLDLRNYHINTVAKYVLVPAHHARLSGCPLGGVGMALDSRGAGGSNIMGFLKTVRNNTQKALIAEPQDM
uniref:Indoleamine 2,3-dioxygenase 2-like n=1 Tax=Neogobius melanostomus TaxID=47308 RepID=A0A8C6US99_9GOBI